MTVGPPAAITSAKATPRPTRKDDITTLMPRLFLKSEIYRANHSPSAAESNSCVARCGLQLTRKMGLLRKHAWPPLLVDGDTQWLVSTGNEDLFHTYGFASSCPGQPMERRTAVITGG